MWRGDNEFGEIESDFGANLEIADEDTTLIKAYPRDGEVVWWCGVDAMRVRFRKAAREVCASWVGRWVGGVVQGGKGAADVILVGSYMCVCGRV